MSFSKYSQLGIFNDFHKTIIRSSSHSGVWNPGRPETIQSTDPNPSCKHANCVFALESGWVIYWFLKILLNKNCKMSQTQVWKPSAGYLLYYTYTVSYILFKVSAAYVSGNRKHFVSRRYNMNCINILFLLSFHLIRVQIV